MPTAPSDLLQQYTEQGFVVVRDAVKPTALDPLIRSIERGVDAYAARLLAEGAIRADCAGQPFTTRLARLHEQHEIDMRSWDEIVDADVVRGLARDPGILDALAGLLGPEITFSGDYHLRPKLPGAESTAFPWHQDSQYYSAAFARGAKSSDETAAAHILTAWIPLVDVDETNGCLWVIPGSHRWGLLAGERGEDFNIRTLEDVERRGTPTPVPMQVGDALFFTNLTCHASEVNRSEGVRWSFDLRYVATPGATTSGSAADRALAHYLSRRRDATRTPVAVRGSGVA